MWFISSELIFEIGPLVWKASEGNNPLCNIYGVHSLIHGIKNLQSDSIIMGNDTRFDDDHNIKGLFRWTIIVMRAVAPHVKLFLPLFTMHALLLLFLMNFRRWLQSELVYSNRHGQHVMCTLHSMIVFIGMHT